MKDWERTCFPSELPISRRGFAQVTLGSCATLALSALGCSDSAVEKPARDKHGGSPQQAAKRNVMSFTLKDLNFDVEKADISAQINDPYWCDKYNHGSGKELFWGVSIDMVTRRIEDTGWSPRIYTGRLRFPTRRWTDLAHHTFEWTTPADAVTGESNGGFYVFEHAEIPQAKLQILDRRDNRFHLLWTGLGNVYWDKKYWENVPFSTEATAVFGDIFVHGSEKDNDNTMRERFAQYLDPADFTQTPIEFEKHTYESGVKMARAIFKPKF